MLKQITNLLSYIDNLFLLGLAVGIYIYWVCIASTSYQAEDFTGAWDYLGGKVNKLMDNEYLKKEYNRIASFGSKTQKWDFLSQNLPKFLSDTVFAA